MKLSSWKRGCPCQASRPVAWLLRYLEVAWPFYIDHKNNFPISTNADKCMLNKVKYAIQWYVGESGMLHEVACEIIMRNKALDRRPKKSSCPIEN